MIVRRVVGARRIDVDPGFALDLQLAEIRIGRQLQRRLLDRLADDPRELRLRLLLAAEQVIVGMPALAVAAHRALLVRPPCLDFPPEVAVQRLRIVDQEGHERRRE